MSPPIEFQHDMSLALKNSGAPCPKQVTQQTADRQSRRFDIYRNNRMVSLIDNLKATYPSVCKLVGDEYFSAVAREYIKHHPPVGPVMAEYGDKLGLFIKASPNADKIPYIADVAALEWARLQAYHAQDSQALPADTLTTFSPDDYGLLCFTRHPSLSLLSSQWAVGSLWSAIQLANTPTIDLNRPENVVIVRPADEVMMQVLPSSGAMLLDRLIQGDSLLVAVSAVTRHDPDFDPGLHLQGLIGLGAFTTTYLQG